MTVDGQVADSATVGYNVGHGKTFYGLENYENGKFA